MPVALSQQRLRSIIESLDISQKALVERTGISRAQLSRILSRKDPAVREDTLVRLARGLGVAPTSITVAGPLAKLRESIANETGEVDFRGMGFPKIEAQKIEDVFIDLETEEYPPRKARAGLSPDACQEPGLGDFRIERAQRPVLGLERLASNDRAVLIGNPGSGKTTILRFLAHRSCSREGPLTLYVRLPEYCKAREAEDELTPIQFVAGHRRAETIPGVVEALDERLRDQKTECVFLFDGLDEIGGDQRQAQLIRELLSFVETYPYNRFVVTSRAVGFDAAPWVESGFSVFKVRDYGVKQLREFTEKWSVIIARTDRINPEKVRESIASEVFAHARVRALASNPLISTILVLLHNARGGMLPTRRVDLYAKVVDVFLESWEGSKTGRDALGSAYNISLDRRELRWLLSDVSLAMQKAERTVAARWWLTDHIFAYLQNKLGFEPDEGKENCDRILRYLCERTGLIAEVGPDTFAFSHRTLQEYFGSLGVIDDADSRASSDVTECMREYLYHPQWAEVVRLVAAQSTPPTAESLLATLADDPDPVGRFIHRGAFAALRCLSDGATVANRKFVASLFESIAELGRSKWLGITFEAIEILERFESSRLEQVARRTIEQILESARLAHESDELPSDDLEAVENRIDFERIWEEADAVVVNEDEEGAVAVREVTVTLDDRTHKLFCVNYGLLIESPDQWYESCCQILKSDDASGEVKRLVVRELGKRVATMRQARIRLRKILTSSANEKLRAASASYLSVFASQRREQELLVQHMGSDPSEQVRGECAAALGDVAAGNKAIGAEIADLLESDEPVAVRAGAARGLGALAGTQSCVRTMLLKEMMEGQCANEVRLACLWALSEWIDKHSDVLEAFRKMLDMPIDTCFRQGASQAIASAMVNEAIPWDHHDIERIEHILMSLEDPCPHALWGLQEIATARALRAGLRLDAILQESLQPHRDKIDLAFVFGSMARKRQQSESDVDLFIIGSVTQKELAGELSGAERVLGRRINAVINSASKFAKKWRSRDPFVLEISGGPKIQILESRNAGDKAGGIDDELRAMATVGLDSDA